MLDIAGLTSATGATAELGKADKSAGKLAEDMDDFLQIFVAQLQNQDPLEPQDSSEFTNQIANLSGVEQAIATNQNLETLISLNSAGKEAQGMLGFIGKDVETDSSVVTLEENRDVYFSYHLDGTENAQNITVEIYDLHDQLVFKGTGSTEVGRNSIHWDGTNNQGEEAEPGLYQVIAFYPDPEDPEAVKQLDTTVRGKVIGANLLGDEPTLIVNGTEVPLEEIQFVGEAL